MPEPLYILIQLLRPALEDIEPLKQAIEKNIIPWQDIITLANQELLVPALYWSLARHNVLESISDTELLGYLKEVFDRNTLRNQLIVEQIIDLDHLLGEIKVAPLLLKGAVALTESVYDHPGIRCMTDIDLMVPEGTFDTSLKHLKRHAYRETGVSAEKEDHHHWDALMKPGMPAALELHERIEKHNFIRYTEATTLPCRLDDTAHSRVLTPSLLLYHAFLHSEVSHRHHHYRHLALRHLYDFVILAEHYAPRIDWQGLSQIAHADGVSDIFDSYLLIAERIFGFSAPLNYNTLYARHHYRMTMIQQQFKKNFSDLCYFTLFNAPRVYSYERMKRLYNIRSKWEYPLAVGRHFWHLALTHIGTKKNNSQ